MGRLVLVEDPAPHVRQLTLNRPEQLNAMTAELCEELHGEVQRIASDRACRAVILTGAGRGFCAGLDLRGYGAARRPATTAATSRATGSQTRSTCRRSCSRCARCPRR